MGYNLLVGKDGNKSLLVLPLLDNGRFCNKEKKYRKGLLTWQTEEDSLLPGCQNCGPAWEYLLALGVEAPRTSQTEHFALYWFGQDHRSGSLLVRALITSSLVTVSRARTFLYCQWRPVADLYSRVYRVIHMKESNIGYLAIFLS